MPNAVVQDWLFAIRMATNESSPFKGMVDLREIFDLPLETQHKIYNALTEQERDRLKNLYGAK